MASLTFETGVESHPEIAIDSIDLKRELINFRWVGGPHSGECAETFTVTLADHGEMTVNQMVAAIAAEMTSRLPGQE